MSKTKISAEIVADSVNPWGDRITSMVLTFPRIVLAEFNTHRMFSRNSASSRAIPFEKMLNKVKNDPFVPLAFQKEHKGMQGTEYILPENIYHHNQVNIAWYNARNAAIEQAEKLDRLSVTKQLANRLLEPFLWHKVLVTATHYENFFELRCPQYQDGDRLFRSRRDYILYHLRELKANRWVIDELEAKSDLDWLRINKSAAEIHISRLAECMWDAMNESTPKQLTYGEWHIPFGDNIDLSNFFGGALEESGFSFGDFPERHSISTKLQIATARCARTSYDNFEGTSDFEKDIKLYESLKTSKHASPFEHCAQTMTPSQYATHIKSDRFDLSDATTLIDPANLGWSRNFKGFLQYRETIGL